MILQEFIRKLQEYLQLEKGFIQQDIADHDSLPREEKITFGYLVPDAIVSMAMENTYELMVFENFSKFRTGDRVLLVNSQKKLDATIIENTPNYISLKVCEGLVVGEIFDILIKEAVTLDPIIQLIAKMEDNIPGVFYINQLCAIESPITYGNETINLNLPDFTRFNTQQANAIKNVLQQPSLYCIQGPPGTGKTDVLAFIAKTCSEDYKNVLVVSNTHQAVNNALNQVSSYGVPTIKIGEALKALDLNDRVKQIRDYKEHKAQRGRRRLYDKGEVIGMTLHRAVVELGLKRCGFYPDIILVDEAGQIPLSFGATLGMLGSGSIVLIGDDRQMPPIFHPSLSMHELSTSVFTYVSELYPSYKTVLDTTYRMDSNIAAYVSRCFYEPYGIKLTSNRVPKDNNSVEIVSISNNQALWQEYNPEEAEYAAKRALEYSISGCSVAIITPFRKQVNCIKSYIKAVYENDNLAEHIPIIDTVERLQGQSVDVIIISMSVNDRDYYYATKSFILDPHRLNVMFSRAKEKVLLIKSDMVELPTP